ncbi:hypothetical protein E2C01_090795 [Portunus trituberculatus]|uniref:Uncharacterized protein n=1 Tax=Portunus trituberculatus TaxID=210409 RepID=A0A5B7JR36_PORTR|nr:hypothetical protein [Portunus trituberculatus]
MSLQRRKGQERAPIITSSVLGHIFTISFAHY